MHSNCSVVAFPLSSVDCAGVARLPSVADDLSLVDDQLDSGTDLGTTPRSDVTASTESGIVITVPSGSSYSSNGDASAQNSRVGSVSTPEENNAVFGNFYWFSLEMFKRRNS